VKEVVQDTVAQLQSAGHQCHDPPSVELPAIFVGSENRQANVATLLEEHKMVVLHGMAGAGKSTLAYAVYEHAKRDLKLVEKGVRFDRVLLTRDMDRNGIVEPC
jgi:predicted GTPase